MTKVVIAGGGPAGLMAAIRAAEKNANVTILEKMEKPARKLRITGKGRCNITNTKPEDDFLENIFPDARFFRPSFGNFSNLDLIDFLNNAGLTTVEERGCRVFPASQKAWDVAEVLLKKVRERCRIECKAKVTGLDIENRTVKTLYYEQYGQELKISGDAFIIATGGISYPLTGSTGDGYEWAQQTGHKIVPLRPSLTGLELNGYSEIKNCMLKNVELSLLVDNRTVKKEFGEMNFTKYGIDGPIVLKVSRNAVDAVLANKKVEILINLKPALSEEQLVKRIDRDTVSCSDMRFFDMLKNLLPAPLIDLFLKKTAIPAKKQLKDLNSLEIEKLITNLVSLKFAVKGYRPFSEAIVTAGGIDLKDVNRKTMRSKHIDNLFFAGEILDLDANTGGYNLQIAFSTGYLAGEKAAALHSV
ncbi:MAG: NAD(P)/FAD-dependent oxidoreductase [Prevotellaceae bacterium]|jgi:predicted Rossmann fold flavoprotein|nr:NAD(P)/FAD-dependent oxidoreductase [Prevotellaceae bacterium]